MNFLTPSGLCVFQQHLGAVDVRGRECERVAEAGVDGGVGGQVDDGIDVVFTQTSRDVLGRGDVPLEERKIGPALEHLCIIQRRYIL